IATWSLTARGLGVGPRAKPRDLASLAKAVERKLPPELATLLAAHGSIGDRECGPPVNMLDLLEELPDLIANHEADDPSPPRRRGLYDVRGFAPSKNA